MPIYYQLKIIYKMKNYNKKIVIGSYKDPNENGIPYSIEIELTIKTIEKEAETINHKKISKYQTLSLSGSIYKSAYNWLEGGQIDDTLRTDKNCHFIINEMEKARILDIWKKYHLNDMSPNCKHQKAFNCNVGDYETQAEEQTKKCPNGYKYGSKWLVKQIPSKIITEIINIFKNN